MAAMDQVKLSTMCSNINGKAGEYEQSVTSGVNALADVFNSNWCSASAAKLGDEISTCLGELAIAITQRFSQKNASVASAVTNFNSVEGENIHYPGFSFGTPTTTLSLNATLPNGKVGVAEGADLSTISEPMTTLVSNIDSALDGVCTAVSTSDAFDSAEVEALTTSVNNIKSTFDTHMEELKSSLSTRMSGEIAQRDALNQANQQNLES